MRTFQCPSCHVTADTLGYAVRHPCPRAVTKHRNGSTTPDPGRVVDFLLLTDEQATAVREDAANTRNCSVCNAPFIKPAGRGRPPTTCPAHRPKGQRR